MRNKFLASGVVFTTLMSCAACFADESDMRNISLSDQQVCAIAVRTDKNTVVAQCDPSQVYDVSLGEHAARAVLTLPDRMIELHYEIEPTAKDVTALATILDFIGTHCSLNNDCELPAALSWLIEIEKNAKRDVTSFSFELHQEIQIGPFQTIEIVQSKKHQVILFEPHYIGSDFFVVKFLNGETK